MWRKALTGAAVALGVLAMAAGASAQRPGEVAGKWKAQAASATGSTQTCNVELTATDWFGAYRASSFGCSGKLFGVSKWQARGSELVLLGGGDRELARLSLRGERLVGEDADGKPVTMTRDGAAPRLAGGGRDDDRPGGGWDRRQSSCVRYGDTGRCASRADMRPPAVRTLAAQDLRSSPDAHARSLSRAPANACLEVEECRTERGDLWCRVRERGQSGYLRQIEGGRGGERLMFRGGCD